MALTDSGENNLDAAAARAAQSDALRRLELTADQQRRLAEKLYAMLLADVRLMNARRQEPLPRRSPR